VSENQTEKDQKDENLVVLEQKDGTVTVQGMEGAPVEDKEAVNQSSESDSDDGGEPKQAAEGGQVDDDDQDQPNDTEAIRSARREKRRLKKQMHREQQREKDLRFQQLAKQNQELLARLSAVEQRTHGSEMARIDKAIQDQQVRIQYAKMKIAEATTSQDGEALANAQEMWFEARRASEALENLKKQASQPKRQAPTAPDISVQRHAASWMERNSWYDPGKKDRDSKIATVIDEEMVSEGWDPRSADYWQELDDRLKDALPHRYNHDIDGKSSPRRPRSVVTGSGRESAASSGGKNTFTLSRDQVQAMKDAGMWEDPALRAKMIRRYQQDALKNRS
jgi:hypothetical protein